MTRPARRLFSAFALTLTTAALVAPTAAAAPSGANLPTAAERTITVATFNVHHGAGADGVLDLERIAGVLEDSNAEVIGLQEVDKPWGERSDFEDQAAWLARRLGMDVCYTANLVNPPAVGQSENRQARGRGTPSTRWTRTGGSTTS